MGIMETFLNIRSKAKGFYIKYQKLINPVLKFIFAFIAVYTVNKELHYNAKLAHIVVCLGVAAVGAFTPATVSVVLCALLAVAQLYFASPFLAAFMLVVYIILYCFLARFSGKYSYAMLAIPILFVYKIPYAALLLVGLTAAPIAILPVSCGVMVYYLFGIVKVAAVRVDVTSLDDTLALYKDVVDNILANKEMLVTVGIFAVVVLVMYAIRNIRFEFVFELDILVGALVNIILSFIMHMILGVYDSLGKVVLYTFLSALLVFVYQFFRLVLNYLQPETVQFEDDEYYYYVNAIPKIDTLRDRKIDNEEETGEPEEEEEADLSGEESEETDNGNNGNKEFDPSEDLAKQLMMMEEDEPKTPDNSIAGQR